MNYGSLIYLAILKSCRNDRSELRSCKGQCNGSLHQTQYIGFFQKHLSWSNPGGLSPSGILLWGQEWRR